MIVDGGGALEFRREKKAGMARKTSRCSSPFSGIGRGVSGSSNPLPQACPPAPDPENEVPFYHAQQDDVLAWVWF